MPTNKAKDQDALHYHAEGRPGKIEVITTKETRTQRDLSLAYSPGVAVPCSRIAEDKDEVYRYTAKGNLVAVISNGTAVLGLGDIGPEASKPVMEGKGVLFKIFADIDVFDLEINSKTVDEVVQVVKALEPTFGGINLEDIKAPECFEIEARLKEEMNIPVMHDDQHGTAIISGAALINALELVGKAPADIRVVVSGAGASALSCVKIFVELGVKQENIVVCDSKGVIRKDRESLSADKAIVATDQDFHTLEEAMNGADVFMGLSRANILSEEAFKTMAKDPIVFAMANPDPEIDPKLAQRVRPDVIIGTGRSDFPNQINNVLGFPFIFRGALDVRATSINEAMKLAAVRAIADLARKTVPDVVVNAYNQTAISFGRDYIIPKPLDPRLLTTVAPAVAKAAIESGVAKRQIDDWDAYESELIRRMGTDENLIRLITNKARQAPQRVVFTEAEHPRILKSAQIAVEEGIAHPILLGNPDVIAKIAHEHAVSLEGMDIIDPHADTAATQREAYGKVFFEKRKRRGYNYYEAISAMQRSSYFGMMMVEMGDADALLSGLSRKYPDTIRPALEIIGVREDVQKMTSMYLLLTERGPLFLADTTVIEEPTAEELAAITVQTAHTVRDHFNIQPHVALLSYSNYGSSDGPDPKKMRRAVEMLDQMQLEFVYDGEVQADFALGQEKMSENYPFSPFADRAPNILIFPNLSSANIAYKLLQVMQGAEAIGPILLGAKKPVHVLQLGSTVREIVHMITIATLDAQRVKAEHLQAIT